MPAPHITFRYPRIHLTCASVYPAGPYATENARTALEHGAVYITFAVRRHGIICPEMVDYVNYVRDYDETFGHPAAGRIC